ncbi:glycosyltransferase [Parvibaculum sp.]|uniref:glycosyltransferase n=1 Tax=Parvibaculum sp. TaxID=2024848 RepID=UPI00320C9F0C
MPKIVHIITRFVNGGADENTLLTCNAQAEAHDVTLIHGAENSGRMIAQLDARVRRICVPSLVREIAPAKDLAALARLSVHLRRLRPDIVHTHTSKAGVIGRMAALAAPGAAIVHGVHILSFNAEGGVRRRLYLGLERLVAPVTHAFINVSEGMREECLQHGLGEAARHWVIASGMEVDRFRGASPADFPSARSGGERPIRICYVAALERRKRHRELLKAVVPLLRMYPHVELILAGEGPERAGLEAAAREAGIESQVQFLGFRDDIESVLAASDICVFTSEREGLPRALIQYALAGKPIVATRLPGIERVLRDGSNGYVVSADAFDEFATRLQALILDRDLRARMAAQSQSIDFSDWDGQRMTGQLEAVYRKLLSGRTRGGRGSRDAQRTGDVA